ncbi:MalY/PatB family protein [Marinobacter sp. C2H3]|uniref:MalY/PatB family protein n=1 Tax=Marinobacter sp. C2H3 TaxID=3119003 RepID=UPI00300F7508
MSRFDQCPSREGTAAVKLDARQAVFGRADVVPAWVADMDFAAPEAVTEALVARARHPVYGYTLFPDSLYEAMIDWFERRHGLRLDREAILMAPGVVPSLHAACLAFAGSGEGVIVQPPVYPPFFSSVTVTGRRVIENPLRCIDGDDGPDYAMDLDHLEACAARPEARLLLLCSPHNPVGRVWRRDELDAVLAIARRHGLVVFSDDIHADLVYPGEAPHTLLASLATEEDALVTALAPSKTFNLPGLGLSALVVPDARRRRALQAEFERLHLPQCNPFSMVGFEAGYRHGGPWLDELMVYLRGNRDAAVSYVREHLPGIRTRAPEGTYLLWLDCRELAAWLDDGKTSRDRALRRFFVQQAGVGLNPGASFGAAGDGFMRLNLGTSRATLMTVLDQIRDALQALRG